VRLNNLKIAIVHNTYVILGGEDVVVRNQCDLLQQQGHEVALFVRSSADIAPNIFGKLRAFISGIYNPSIVSCFRKFLYKEKPDIVHIHNLFPLISPAILPECRRAGIPVVMTVHNYRLICPNGLFFRNGFICEECSGGNEWHCVKNNCEGSYFKSIGYALRNAVARWRRLYMKYVSAYIAMTNFQKRKLVENGFTAEQVNVLGNTKPGALGKVKESGKYVAYLGRMSAEKGIDQILSVARLLPDVLFRLAGKGSISKLPPNIELVGHQSGRELEQFISNSKFGIMASVCYEGFPMVLLDFMSASKPCIVPNLGGIPEVIGYEESLLFSPGNIEEFAQKIYKLWENKEICTLMGKKALHRFNMYYSQEVYYSRLISLYEHVVYAKNPTLKIA
jgi:glycosyltransferase involved in cell wall biosynthesis